jgi:hypothetical protein
MSNTIKELSVGDITRKALSLLHNNLVFAKTISKQYNDSFAKAGAKNGGTLLIREPNQFVVRSGAILDVQDVTEATQTLTVATQMGVDVNFSSVELTLSLDDFAERILNPAMARLAANVDYTIVNACYKDIWKFTNTTHGTKPVLADVLSAKAKLDQGLAPDGDRCFMADSLSANGIITAGQALYHSASEIERQYSRGTMGEMAGFKFYQTEMTPTHTNGTREDTTPTTSTVPMTNGVTSIAVSGNTDGQIYNKGDIFTVVGVYACNPETKAQYSHLQQFVVTSAGTVSSTAVTLYISPTIYISGPLTSVVIGTANSSTTASVSNLDNIVNSGAASGAYRTCLAYHKDAFTMVTADLEMPKGVDFSAREVYDGISLRVVRNYDIVNDKLPCRIDVLFGYKTVRPGWACRIGSYANA